MRIKCVLSAVAAVFAVALAASPASADLSLPDPSTCGLGPTGNCLQFSDFTVYSLDLLNYKATDGGIQGTHDPYYVGTNGVNLQNALVVATGVNGTTPYDNTDLISGGKVDNAYQVPNSGCNTCNYQISGNNSSPDAVNVAGNTTATWDVDVQALVDYIGAGNKLGFFFNLNQNNADQSYLNSPEDALGWLAVTLTDSSGVNGPVTYYLDGNKCGLPGYCPAGEGYAQPTAIPAGQPGYPEAAILPSPDDKWAYIHGQICVDPTLNYTVVGFGACDQAQKDNGDISVNQNLGTDNAAFALYSDQLQKDLLSGNYDTMSVDLRMAALTNGYEQLIIGALTVPEPLTVGLFGMGLFGLTMLRRRKLARA
jgi:hypothetical protein